MKLPPAHSGFVAGAVERLARDPRIVGVAIGGSALTDEADEYSDIDLVIAVEPGAYEEVLAERLTIARSLGPLLSAFTGEHVGEPRLLICLYDAPLIHVDLKFVTAADLAERVENPEVLWERGGAMTTAMAPGEALYPMPDLQWIEDRFWTWIHYAAARAARGELFETLDTLAFLRRRVFGPLILMAEGAAQPGGVRRIESRAPHAIAPLRATVAGHDRDDCFDAIAGAVQLYLEMQDRLASGSLVRDIATQQAAVEYLESVRSTHRDD